MIFLLSAEYCQFNCRRQFGVNYRRCDLNAPIDWAEFRPKSGRVRLGKAIRRNEGSETVSSAVVKPEKEYKEYLAKGRFMLLRDRSNGKAMFHPRVIAPNTGSADLEWIEASGQGVIYSFTVITQKPPARNYNVVLVDLAEGPRMMSRVDGVEADDLAIGMKVKSKIVQDNGEPLLVFVPAES